MIVWKFLLTCVSNLAFYFKTITLFTGTTTQWLGKRRQNVKILKTRQNLKSFLKSLFVFLFSIILFDSPDLYLMRWHISKQGPENRRQRYSNTFKNGVFAQIHKLPKFCGSFEVKKMKSKVFDQFRDQEKDNKKYLISFVIAYSRYSMNSEINKGLNLLFLALCTLSWFIKGHFTLELLYLVKN